MPARSETARRGRPRRLFDRAAVTINPRVSGSVTARPRRASLVATAISLHLDDAKQEEDYHDDDDHADDPDAAGPHLELPDWRTTRRATAGRVVQCFD